MLAPKIVERARALAQQFLAPIVKILRAAKSEAEINELLLFGALTSHEATIIDGDSRVESVFNRLLCLELGQALAARVPILGVRICLNLRFAPILGF